VRGIAARVRGRVRLLSLLAALGCASQAAPPGGPPDPTPPQIVRIRPDSGAVKVSPPRVVFQFDGVVSERPQGAASLADLFLISPRAGDPDVDWERDAITVRPRRGWKKSTVYTVTMLPGLTDVRGNVRREGATAIFSTGPTLPDTRLSGVVFDWVAEQPVVRPFVEAVAGADSTTVYVTQGDSSGRFVFRHLPPGAYTVRGIADANNNRGIDAREAWDSVRVTLGDSATVEVLAFTHDTIGPGIAEVEVRDSVTLRVRLDNPLAPTQQVDTTLFALVGADSARVPLAAAVPARAADELRRAPTDSTPARPDSAPPAPPPDTLPRPAGADTAATLPGVDSAEAVPAARPSKPGPVTTVVITLRSPLRPAATYRLRSANLRGLLGATRSSERSFTTPAAAPPVDTAGAARRAPGDSVRAQPRAPGDTARVQPGRAPADTTRRAPAAAVPVPPDSGRRRPD